MEAQTFQFGAWHVNPTDNSISNAQETRQMEPRAMDVLVALCKEPNTIISAEQLLEQCWGSALYGDNPVHKTIAQLRKLLGDQSSAPEYIETIRKRGYRTLASVQYDYSETSTSGTWIKESPFRGLQAFDEKHAAIFFGRSDAIYRLSQIITQNTNKHTSVELFMVLGTSGSGKTSLVRAGVIPSLMQSSSSLQITSHSSFDLAEQGECSLFTTLAGMLIDLEVGGQGLFPKMSAETLGQQLQENLDDVLTTLRSSLTKLSPPPGRSITYRHALFIDRFEAVFDAHHVEASVKDHFLTVLDKLARSHAVLVILACRNDFYPHIAASPILMEAKARGAHFDLNPPSQAEIAQMIRLPAVAARLSFGVDEQSKVRLDDVLCEGTTGNPDALPLLQYTLHELYRLRSPDGELTFAAFHELGGIEGAIGQRAEQVINALAEEHKQALSQVLSLVTTISTNENIVTSRRAAWAQLSNDKERAVVNALVESRLFVSELVDGAPGFGVAHEALLRRWPRVVEWINHHRSALQIRGRISELAERWQSEGRSQDLLLPEGKQLDEAQSLLTLTTFSLSTEEHALIAASSQRARWHIRLRRTALGAIITLALLASVLGLSALKSKGQANDRRAEVEGIMGYMLGDFVDKLRPLGKLDLLDSVGDKALTYFANTNKEELSQTALLQRAVALRVLGEVRYARGNLDSAIETIKASNSILFDQLAQQPKDLQVLKNILDNMGTLGGIYRDKNDWKQARSYFEEEEKYADSVIRLAPNDAQWLQYKTNALGDLGAIEYYQNNYKAANRYYEKRSRLLKLGIAAMPNSHSLKADLGTVLGELAAIKIYTGELSEMNQLRNDESTINRQILQSSPANNELVLKLAQSLHFEAESHQALGRIQEANKNYVEAKQLLSQILKIEPSNIVWLESYVRAEIGLFSTSSDSWQTRLAMLEEARKTLEKLQRIDPNRPSTIRLHIVLKIEWARELLNSGKVTEAQREIELAQEEYKQLPQQLLDSLKMRTIQVQALIVLADIETRNKRYQQARENCKLGYETLKNDVANTNSYHVLDPWVRINLCLGNGDIVRSTEEKLAKMGYREKNYIAYLDKKVLPVPSESRR